VCYLRVLAKGDEVEREGEGGERKKEEKRKNSGVDM
jgi:hypothetical protein